MLTAKTWAVSIEWAFWWL